MRRIARSGAFVALALACIGAVAPAGAAAGSVDPLLSVTPGPLAFGAVRVGAVSVHQQVEVVNDRAAEQITYKVVVPAGFSAVAQEPRCVPDPLTKVVTLPPGGGSASSCAYAVRFKPSLAGVASKDLLIDVVGSGRDARVPLLGTGVAGPLLPVSTGGLDFGAVRAGASSAFQTFVVSNDLPQDEVLGPINVVSYKLLVPSRFFVVPTDARCAPDPVTKLVVLHPAGGPPDVASGSCTYTIRYAPTIVGPVAKDLVVDIRGTGLDSRIALQAEALGEPVLPVSPVSLDFGEVLVGRSSAPQTFVVTNDLLQDEVFGPVNVVSFKLLVPSVFSATALDPRCAPDPVTKLVTLHPAGGPPDVASGSCSYELRAVPKVSGPVAKDVVIDVQGPGKDARLPLTASGAIKPVLAVSSPTLHFPDASGVGQTLTLTNVGNAKLFFFELASAPPFYLAPGTCGPTLKMLAPLAPGASCSMTVWFWPTTPGPASWTMDIRGTAETVSVAMTGWSD